MASAFSSIRRHLLHLWHHNRPLTGVTLLMVGVLAVTSIGLIVDPRTIGGDPAWLKPAKFAVSTAVYSLTLAWLLTYLPDWPRTRRVVSLVTAVVFVLEVAIIVIQAARGVTSHFNLSTPLDAVLFSVMGAAIGIQTVVSGQVAVALWRQPFADRALGTALRAAMVLTLLGAASAGLMTMPSAEQSAALSITHTMPRSGAHTVGAPDGGAGLPGTGWSRDHGDLRIPHFFGLHALQALPLIALIVGRRRSQHQAVQLVRVAATGYAALFGILLVQALRGESLIAPSGFTVALAMVWALGTMLAIAVVRARRVPSSVRSATPRAEWRVTASR
jgi:hypothetical protein